MKGKRQEYNANMQPTLNRNNKKEKVNYLPLIEVGASNDSEFKDKL